MILSVWRAEAGLYDYFKTSRPPGFPKNIERRVVALEDALPELPDDARHIGCGELAQGSIVADRRSRSSQSSTGPLVLGSVVGLALLLSGGN